MDMKTSFYLINHQGHLNCQKEKEEEEEELGSFCASLLLLDLQANIRDMRTLYINQHFNLLFVSLSVSRAGEAVPDNVIRLKASSALSTPERDRGGTAKEDEEENVIDTRMGVGKNTTSKSMDSSSEGGKYEEEGKHGADFYPIPVHNSVL